MTADTPAEISLRQIHLTAGGRVLLESASADLPARGITLVIGPSGAGKSLLLRALAGLLSEMPQVSFTGHIDWPRETAPKNAPPNVGVVFQTLALFDELSPLENVSLGYDHQPGALPATDEDTPPKLLAELAVPTTVATARLSGGQRQRVAIARVMAQGASVILFDEPTSGLDMIASRRVAQLISRTQAKHPKACVIVTHDYEPLLSIADRVILFNAAEKTLDEIPKSEWPDLGEKLASTSLPPKEEIDRPRHAFLRRLAGFFEQTTRFVEKTLLTPIRFLPAWRSPRWGMRWLLHYLYLVAGPSAWAYLAIAGAIVGFVATYFTFKYLPYSRYTEPLLIEDLLGAVGFALFRVLIPVFGTILIAARCGAAVAADVAVKSLGGQLDAMRTLDARPTRYLLTGMTWAFLLGSPVLTWVSYQAAALTSMVVFTWIRPELGPNFWDLYYHQSLINPDRWYYAGSGWCLAKICLCGVGSAQFAYYLAARRKESPADVSRAITQTILWATIFVLVVHFGFAFYEFE